MASTDGDDLAALSFAIKLLHSSAADSADQIRVLLDKEIEKRYGPERTVATVLSGSAYPEQGTTSNIAKEEQECHKIAKDKLSRHSDKKHKKRKTKAHKDRGKLKLSSFQKKCLDENVETEKSASKSGERRSSGMQFSTQDNAKCVICKEVRNGGTLLECQECQQFYHQDCHHPPALEINVSDPRHVWYCKKCKIAMGKASKVGVVGKTFSDSISSALKSTHSLKQAVQKIAAKSEEVLSMQPNNMSGNTSSKGKMKMKKFQRDVSASRKTTTRQPTPKIESTLKSKPLPLNTGSKQHNSSQLCNRPTTSPLIAQMKAKQLPLSHVKTVTSLSRDQTNLHCSTHGTCTKTVPSKCDIQMKAQKKADPSNFGVQHKAVSTSEGQTNPELSASTSHIKPQLSSSSSHNKPQLSAYTSINKPQLSATAIRTKPQLSTSTGNKPRLSASTSNIKPCMSAATSHNKLRPSASTSNIIPPSASKSHNKPRPSVSTSHAKPQPSDSTTSRIYPKPTDSGKCHLKYGV